MTRIMIIGSIDQDSYATFTEALAKAEDKGLKSVEVELYSEGGSSYAACAFAHRIRTSSCKINITVRGYFASAAILVVAACHYRRMAWNASAMVHEDQIAEVSAPLAIAERELAHFRESEHRWCLELARYTKVSAKSWAALHEETTYMDAEQCLEYGLIDAVLE